MKWILYIYKMETQSLSAHLHADGLEYTYYLLCWLYSRQDLSDSLVDSQWPKAHLLKAVYWDAGTKIKSRPT